MPEEIDYHTEEKMDCDTFQAREYPPQFSRSRLLNNHNNQIQNNQIILRNPIPAQTIQRVATPSVQRNPRVFDAINPSIPVRSVDELFLYLQQG